MYKVMSFSLHKKVQLHPKFKLKSMDHRQSLASAVFNHDL